MLGRLICWITKKHRRGQRWEIDEANKTIQYRCARCGARWVRKVYRPKVTG
jgi:DNA-directed RNA polymerase subunit RPC12/RpoP